MKEIPRVFDDDDIQINIESWGERNSKLLVKISSI